MSNSFPTEPERPTAERLVPPKGKLKIFLGYAAGVGKTYQMLEEAQSRKQQGVDVVVGYFEPHARPDTIALIEGLEVIPRRVMEYRGAQFEEMDTAAILDRHPQVCVVDEFPHTNVPGSERAKRWEDVLVLLEQCDVLTTMNVQHLESLNDQISRISGVRVRETVPDWVVQMADEVVMVDLTPRALLNRLDRGVIYKGDKAQQAKQNFFQESTLVALRELALRETAFEIESRYSTDKASNPLESASSNASPFSEYSHGSQRVLVYVTPEPTSAALLRRGKRIADYLQTECLAVAICPRQGLQSLSGDKREALEKHLNFARNLHIRTHLLADDDIADALVSFARQNGVTQIYLARPKVKRMELPFTQDFVLRVARLARDMEITIAAERQAARQPSRQNNAS